MFQISFWRFMNAKTAMPTMAIDDRGLGPAARRSAKAAMMSSKVGTGLPGCGTQNIRYMKKVTARPPAPTEARK